MIMNGIFCSIDQSNHLFQHQFINLCSKSAALRVFLQLLDIAACESRKPPWLMAEPFSQLRAGGNLLHPFVNCGFLFGNATGPQPVYQYPVPILWLSFLINPLQPEMIILFLCSTMINDPPCFCHHIINNQGLLSI